MIMMIILIMMITMVMMIPKLNVDDNNEGRDNDGDLTDDSRRGADDIIVMVTEHYDNQS